MIPLKLIVRRTKTGMIQSNSLAEVVLNAVALEFVFNIHNSIVRNSHDSNSGMCGASPRGSVEGCAYWFNTQPTHLLDGMSTFSSFETSLLRMFSSSTSWSCQQLAVSWSLELNKCSILLPYCYSSFIL